MRQSDPENPVWHMNYGGVLFEIAKNMHHQGRQEASKPLFKECESELFAAARLFKRQDSLQIAQCYFLIAEIVNYVYGEKDAAKSYYQKALEYSPQHNGALTAINQLMASPSNANDSGKQQALLAPSPAVSASPEKQFFGTDTLMLKNGQMMKGKAVEEEARGVWFEIDQGAKVYFRKDEIKDIRKE